jgi:AAA+ ATPase superfamily predicted ATPase
VPGFTVIPFADLSVVYGSEQLYNRIVLANNKAVPDEVTAEDEASQLVYGPRSYSLTGLLNNSATDLQFLADFLLARFKEPQYRFQSLSVVLDVLSEAQQNEVLDLEIGDVVQVKFTPSGIPPAIEQYCRVIGISHDWSNNEKRVNLSLERLDFSLFILDDATFGILDEDRLSF